MTSASPLWRVSAERLVVLGWSRAILMQLAHPLVATGVVSHSAYRGGSLQAAVRLHHTVGAMLSLTFGDEARRRATIDRILAIHRRVHGTLRDEAGIFPAGTRYSAEDPALLLWVHATLLDSSVEMYTRLVGPLGPDEVDALCEEACTTLLDLGGDLDTAPRTWAALRAYLADVERRGTLHVVAPARVLARAILRPRVAGIPVPLSAAHQRLTLGLLPPSIRALYGFPWDATRERHFARTLALVRAMRRVAPRGLAWWRDARRGDRGAT